MPLGNVPAHVRADLEPFEEATGVWREPWRRAHVRPGCGEGAGRDCAVVRLRRDDAGAVRVDVSGTAWAAGSPTTFVTAKHVVNPRPEGQRWYVVRRTSPASTGLEIWPVEEILVEDDDLDVAILRVPASTVRSPSRSCSTTSRTARAC